MKYQNTKFAPIAFFAFKRPIHTKRSLDTLVKNNLAIKSKIYIFLDGPRNELDISLNQKVLNIVKIFRPFFLEMEIIHNRINKGLSENIIQGINFVLKEHESVIVLEDDIEVSLAFLDFMNNALNKYKPNKKVWHISGYTQKFSYSGDKSRFFWRYMNCWGWATWKDRWKSFFKDPKFLMNKFNSSMIYKFNFYGKIPEWDQVILNYFNKLDTWAVFWNATIFLNQGYCLNPTKTLTRNIGFDSSGENCGTNDNVIMEKLNGDINNIYPLIVEEDEEIIFAIKNSFKRENFLIRKIIFFAKHFLPYGKLITRYLKSLLNFS